MKPISLENINRLVDKLVDLQRGQFVDFAYQIGELVIHELFGGNAQLIHQPGPKVKALTQLANHPRLPFSPATLSRSVGVYELLDRLPQYKNNKNIALGHLYAVLSISTEKQHQLLSTTIEKSWTVERLLKEVTKIRDRDLESRRGRPALPEGIKAINAVERVFKGETPLGDLSFLEELDKDQVEHIQGVVDKMQEWCEQATLRIKRRLKVVDVELHHSPPLHAYPCQEPRQIGERHDCERNGDLRSHQHSTT